MTKSLALWRRRLCALALLSLGLSACAEPEVPKLLIGTFTLINRESPYLIAAPHGQFDAHTAQMVYEFCDRVRWDCLVAEGFRGQRAFFNVNRPTEGMRLTETRFTEQAAFVYSKYVSRIRRLTPRVTFYAEIHGHSHPKLGDTIDVATVGVSKSQAEFIQKQLVEALDREQVGHLAVRIDVLEPIRFNATHARKFGVLSFLSPAVHIELPLSARTTLRTNVVRALAASLPRIAEHGFPFQQFLPPLDPRLQDATGPIPSGGLVASSSPPGRRSAGHLADVDPIVVLQ